MNIAIAGASSRQRMADTFAETAKLALQVMERHITRECQPSGGGYWQPYEGSIDIEGFRISVEGAKQVEFGSQDLGTLTVQTLSIKHQGKKQIETTEEVLKFEFEMENGLQHLVLDPKPMKLVPKANDKGRIIGTFTPGAWERKFPQLLSV